MKTIKNLIKAASFYEVSLKEIVAQLKNRGFNVEHKPNFQISNEMRYELEKVFGKNVEVRISEMEKKLESLKKAINTNEEVKKSLDRVINNLSDEKNEIQNEIGEKKREIDWIVKEKQRLILDIQIHAKANVIRSEKTNIDNENFETFEIREFIRSDIQYALGLDNFLDSIQGAASTRKLKNSLYLISKYKGLLCRDIKIILKLAKLTNNCKVLIQQVEPDWLKFERFYCNGLSKIWRLAHSEPTVIHFLVLQDINLSSIECYGKPLLDLIEGIRLELPGERTGFPENLKIFGVPIMRSDEKFGLPLLEGTYSSWVGIESYAFDEPSSMFRLSAASFNQHSILEATNDIKSFFN